MDATPTAIGIRLSMAVELWSVSHDRIGKEGPPRMFQRAMNPRLSESGGKAGASYRTILAYLGGESEPSVQWLRIASDLLGVGFVWLIAGDGPMTDTAEPASRQSEALAALDKLRYLVLSPTRSGRRALLRWPVPGPSHGA